MSTLKDQAREFHFRHGDQAREFHFRHVENYACFCGHCERTIADITAFARQVAREERESAVDVCNVQLEVARKLGGGAGPLEMARNELVRRAAAIRSMEEIP